MTGSQETETRSDLELLALSRKGDREAFGQLVSRYHCACMNLATCMLRNRAEAEDEVQKACWKAFEHLNQYLGNAEFLVWLLRIVVNECRMLMRTKKRARLLYLDGDHRTKEGGLMELHCPVANPEQEFARREMLEVLQREIHCIPWFLRSVILLRDIEELPMPDVAERLGITVPAAKSRLLRARSELRERLMQRCKPANDMIGLSIQQTLPARSARRSALVV